MNRVRVWMRRAELLATAVLFVVLIAPVSVLLISVGLWESPASVARGLYVGMLDHVRDLWAAAAEETSP
jgi:hypothetical protein